MYREREQVLTRTEKQTKLAGARLRGGRFAGVDLSDTVLVAADCTNAIFVNVDLRRADFTRALLTNALFLGCDLADTCFNHASVTRSRFIACSGLGPHAVRTLHQRGANVPKEAISPGGRPVATR